MHKRGSVLGGDFKEGDTNGARYMDMWGATLIPLKQAEWEMEYTDYPTISGPMQNETPR